MSLERTATVVSSVTALLLMVIKLFVGIVSGSISVLSSAIDSLLDMCVSIFNFIAIKNSEKPTDSQFNYGRGKIEALASLFEGIIITLSGLYILYVSIIKIIQKEQVSYLNEAIIVMVVSVLITAGLVYFLENVAKKTNNLVIKSDALHYKTDLYSNAGILLGLAIIHFTGFFYIDSLIGIAVAIFIIYSAYDLIKKGFLLLLDVALNEDEVNKIKNIIQNKNLVSSYHCLKTRESGHFKFVDVHIVFNPTISLLEAHRVSDEIEDEISKLDESKKWIYNIHLDPYDDSAINEEN